ncbi:MAG: ParB/RepB/Spo0J family partition protein [Planctomycetes bacterium]|nr:ParB/RepB/Spo0J family partition protein [Planctomycetota bacterium]
MTSAKKLGKGLGSLLTNTHATDSQETGGPLWVQLEELVANSQQPRLHLDRGIEALAESLRRHGMMQPIVVTRQAGGKYEILAGERRWRASQLAGLKKVPILVREGLRGDAERLELALIENVQREDLDPIERAQACDRLIREYGVSQEQVAERLGYERSTVANLVRLLDLPANLREAVSRETITAGHARALLRLNGTPEQSQVFDQVVEGGLSVRATEAICKKAAESGVRPRHKARPRKPPWVLDLQERLARKTGGPVEIALKKGQGGKMVLHFSSLDHLDELSQLFSLASETEELLEG